MAINRRLLVKPPSTGITPSEHFGVVLYEGDGSSSHSINGGKFGAAGFFENAGVIQIPDNITNTNEHSFSVWFNVNDASGNQTLLEIDTGNRIIFRIASTDANKANFGNGGWFNHGLSFSANQWYHLAITFKSGSPAKIYVNGSLQYTSGNISKASYGSNNYLGAANGSGSGSVQGKIDQFRVFQKELSSSEVSTLYAETVDTVTSLNPLSEDTTDTLQVLGDTSCIATYQFENNETDLSGNHNGTGSQIQYAAGRYGQAASFDNDSNTKITLGTLSSVIPNNTTGVSFSFWVYLNTVNTGSDYDHWFIGQESYGGAFSDGEFSVRLYEGKVYTDYAQSSSIYRQRRASTVLSTGKWHHIVATYDTSNANITEVYLNGVSDTSSNLTSGGTFTTTALFQNSENMTIGGGGAGTDGKIDQFRIFTKVLSASEVTTLYEENSLVASYRFEGNANDDMRAYDGTASNVTYEYGLGFKPDFVWTKRRNSSRDHNIYDSTRGVGNYLTANNNGQQYFHSTLLTSFDTGGFTLSSAATVNADGDDYVAWCFKANGGTTSSNTDGTNITSTVQVNSDAGFSIVKWTGDGNASSKVGHGLGVKPDMIISKALGEANDWNVNHVGIPDKIVYLQSAIAAFSGGGTNGLFGYYSSNTATTFEFINGSSSVNNVNKNNIDYIAYCFHSVDGFSKFGSYVGNGSSDGPIIETGFEPAFLMIRRIDTDPTGGAGNMWVMYDNLRSPSNPRKIRLWADGDSAEATYTQYSIDFLSNGFQLKDGSSGFAQNTNGGEYIYMAFAADPDTEAPTVAKSFNTVTWTGTGSSKTIDGLGFAPNLVWLKQRGGTTWHNIQDTINGATKHLYTNASNAQDTTTDGLTSFDSDGFTLGGGNGFNGSSQNMVAWAWKADDNEPTIFGGPAKAVYKFEDNANDVTGNYNGTASNVSYSSSGKFNKAADFSTSGANIAIGSVIPNTDTAVSVSAWIYLNSGATSYETVIGAGSASSGSEGPFRVNVRYVSANTYKIEALRQIGGTYYNTALSNYTDSSMNVETWHHVVWTYHPSGRTLTTYLNGSKVDTLELGSSGSSVNDSTSVIGNFRTNHSSDNFNGLIDQVRIYNGVVSDVGVAELYAESTSQNDDLELGGPPKILISANANAGFSIVKYTGDGVAGKKVPHGLSAAPEMIIVKNLSNSHSGNAHWAVYHTSLGATKVIYLNRTNAATTTSAFWNNTTPTSTVFSIGNDNDVNVNGEEFIAYCFHSVSGFSKIGSFTGTGTGTNQLINTGFQPDWVMFKDYSAGGSWWIQDSPRGSSKSVKANSSDAESTTNYVTFESNGFRVSGDANGTSDWIYMAFKIN